MNSKVAFALAVLGMTLLASYTVSCDDAAPAGELYIADPNSGLPFIVSDMESPILKPNSGITFVCYANRCQARCKSLGYRVGRCNIQAICVCSR